MYRHRVVPVLGLLCTFVAQTAHAFFDPPWVTPAAPRAGEIVSVNIRGGGCDAIFERPGYPQIARKGNSVRLVEYGDRAPSGWCIYDVGTLNEPIGAFPSGDYTVIVDFAYYDLLGPTTINLGVIPFTVTGATYAASVPAADSPALFALLLLVSGLALCVLRASRRGH